MPTAKVEAMSNVAAFKRFHREANVLTKNMGKNFSNE